MSDHGHTTFLTGATGFLGGYLLRDLLRRGRRIIAMLRPPMDASRARLEQLMRPLGLEVSEHIDSGELTLVTGSLPDELPDASGFDLDDILACAASLQLFCNGNAEPHRTNVEGSRNLIQWARRYDIRTIHAVSTAYVCGSHTKNVDEVLHHPKPEFETEYEHSKWLAESVLDEWGQQDGNRLTLYRPSFLVGDSISGYTTQYGGFYQLARLVSMLKDRYGQNGESTFIPLRIPGSPDDLQNFVPVDFASTLICEVMNNETLHGSIYHLTDPAPPSNGCMKRYLEDYFQMHGGYFAVGDEFIGECTPAESLLWEQHDVIAPRIVQNPRFVQPNTAKVMQAADLEFPMMNKQRFFNLLDYAISQRWGQRGNGRSHGRGKPSSRVDQA